MKNDQMYNLPAFVFTFGNPKVFKEKYLKLHWQKTA